MDLEGGSVYVSPGGVPLGLSRRGFPGPAPSHPLPPAPDPGSRPLPLGDRRPSKKHAGTRPLKEPPHGKSSGRRTWRRDRVPFFFLLLLPGAVRAVPLLTREPRLGFGPSEGVEGRWGSEAARLGPLGQRHRQPSRGAQVILPASSRSLQPSADTQQQRAGGGVRGREGKGEKKSWCCRCP